MKNEKKTNVLGNGIVKLARKIGDASVKECWAWFHQPKVPECMKKTEDKNEKYNA